MSRKKPVVTPAVAPVAAVKEPVAVVDPNAALIAAAAAVGVDPVVLAATAAVEQGEAVKAPEVADAGADEAGDQGAVQLLQQAAEGEAATEAQRGQIPAIAVMDEVAFMQVEAAAETISVSMGFMQQELGEYVKVMRPGYPVPAEQGVQNQMRLFRCIEGILRQEGAEFFQQLNYLLAVFKENRDGAFSERYLFRFWDNLALSQRDRTLFERLLNLFVITADHTSRADAVKHVDLNKTVQLITSGPAQERMFQFYAM